MSKDLAPLKVSPVIKTARWACFILGIFFGYTKLQSLRAYEKIAGPKREAQLHKEYKNRLIKDFETTKSELMQTGRELEVTEFPEGWEKEL